SNKNKEGLGYSVVPPPIAQIYSSPKKDLSWTGLPEFANDTITDYSRPSPAIESTSNDAQNKNPSVTNTGASDSTILSKPFIKFVKAADCTEVKTNKIEAIRKSYVKYAEMYRRTTKKPNGELLDLRIKLMRVSNLDLLFTDPSDLQNFPLLTENFSLVTQMFPLFVAAAQDMLILLDQRSNKNKEGLGYSVVPPPIAQIYSSPKKDLSWTGLPEFANDTITDYSRPSPAIESTSNDAQNKNPSVTNTGASDSTILSKPFIKFVKAADCTEVKTNKIEAIRKSSVKYAEMYRRTTKKPNVRGNQKN
nr:hypothetical protein [Tanacetum cinerariifolium]